MNKSAEADVLERGAAILAKSFFTSPGSSPAVSQLEQALEVLLRREAERVRHELRGRKSLAAIFPDLHEKVIA